jgi:hypothetical protein
LKEFVLVEFLVNGVGDEQLLKSKLDGLGADFETLKEHAEWEDEESTAETWLRITGKINSEVASLIKLQDRFLSDRMRVSCIPEDMKDKYRR